MASQLAGGKFVPEFEATKFAPPTASATKLSGSVSLSLSISTGFKSISISIDYVKSTTLDVWFVKAILSKGNNLLSHEFKRKESED